MRAAVFHGSSDLRMEERPTPQPASGDVVVRVRACGICATDVKLLSAQGTKLEKPMVLGHEVAGQIAELGEGVAGFNVGDTVAAYPIAVCGECFFCNRGLHSLCTTEHGLAHGLDGGFAEYVLIPARIVNVGGLVKIGGLDFSLAAMAEPLSCCLEALRWHGSRAGDSVLIVGSGPMGLFHTLVSKWAGLITIVADPINSRLAVAARVGADTVVNPANEDVGNVVKRLAPHGADALIFALGNMDAVGPYLQHVRKGGVVNLFGGPPRGAELTIDPRWLHYGQIRLTGTFASSLGSFAEALSLIADGQVDVRPVISHRFALDELPSAVEQFGQGKLLKGVVLM